MDAILTVAPTKFLPARHCGRCRLPSRSRFRRSDHPLSLCPTSVPAVARIGPVAGGATRRGAGCEPASPSAGEACLVSGWRADCPWGSKTPAKSSPAAARQEPGGTRLPARGASPCASARPLPHCCAMPRCLRLDAGFGPLFGMHALRFSVLPPASGRCCRCGRNRGLSGRHQRGALSAGPASKAHPAARPAVACTRAGRLTTCRGGRVAGPRRPQGMARAHRAPVAWVTSMFRGQEMGARRP
jgi:hypothetical protein